MATNTKHLKLIKQEENEYYDLNVINENLDIIDSELGENSTSEDLLNENIKSFKVGVGTVNGELKDYSKKMKQSIIAINNINGKTQKIKDRYLRNIDCTLIASCYNENCLPSNLIFEPINGATSTFNNSTNTLTVTGTRISSYSGVKTIISGLKHNTMYYVYAELNTDVHYGEASLDYNEDGNYIVSMNMKNPKPILIRGNKNGEAELHFYCSSEGEVQGIATFSNISIRKIRDYVSTDMILRSIPTGVKDEFIDGMYIQNVMSYTLNGSENWMLIEDTKPNTNLFIASLPNMSMADKTKLSLNCNKFIAKSDDDVYNSDEVGLSVGGGQESKQLVFRVDKGLGDVASLKYYLSVTEKDITVEYASAQKKSIPIDAYVKANAGDIICVGSTLQATCNHRVELNTKSQVDTLQNTLQHTKKSIWNKLKDFSSLGYRLDFDGYIRLPSWMGGILIQWGQVKNQAGSDTAKFIFPSSFSSAFYTVQLTGHWSYSNEHYWVIGGTDYVSYVDCVKNGQTSIQDVCFILAIGR